MASSDTWLFYADESYDRDKFCLSCFGLNVRDWDNAYNAVRAYRDNIRKDYGVRLREELHATRLVGGRGDLGPRQVTLHDRSKIFAGALATLANLPNVRLFNICLDKRGHRDPQGRAWERLFNRIHTALDKGQKSVTLQRKRTLAAMSCNLRPAHLEQLQSWLLPYELNGLVIADGGYESQIMEIRRRMGVFNYVGSKYGSWGTSKYKNIPIGRVREDALFKDSKHSYLIQLADCASFALLKREVPPTPKVLRYGIHKLWDKFMPNICVTEAHKKDPYGIVR